MKISESQLLNRLTNQRPIAFTDIPNHWGIVRAKYIFQPIDERSKTGEEELLSVSHKTGVSPRSEKNVTMFMAESYKGYKLCKPKDLVINSLWVWMKALGFSEYYGIVSTAYGVYRLYNEKLVNYKYLDYLLRSDLYAGEYLIRSKGIWTSRLLLSDNSFFNIPIIVPPRKEQDAIVNFLDEKLADIDKYISIKQKQIDLLLEQIYTIVLAGFTSKKISWSFNWLNAIPNDWTKKKSKFIFEERKVFDQPKEQLLAVTQDKGVLPKSMCESNFVSPASSLVGLKFVEINDFVISLRSFQGGIEFSKYRGIVSPAYNVIRLKKNLVNNDLLIYYKYLFKTKRFIQLLNTIISGIRDGKNINYGDFANLILPIPSKADLLKIRNLCTNYELMKTQFEKEEKRLYEYCSSLISEAVTGKLTPQQFNKREIKPKNIYYARTVLAAEIISNLYQEPTFGHTKFAKILFLIERHASLKLNTHYHRQAAGPYDNKAIRSIDKQLKEQKWFETLREKGRVKYVPMSAKGKHINKYTEYYSSKKDKIEFIIDTFKTAKTEQCEIVATLYSAWEDLLKEGECITDDRIVNEVLNNWNESKKRISHKRWMNALNWMRQKNIFPSI